MSSITTTSSMRCGANRFAIGEPPVRQTLWRSIYRDNLFPRTEYAAAWKVLQRELPRRDTCRRMADLLFIAAKSPVTRPARQNWRICWRQISTRVDCLIPERRSPASARGTVQYWHFMDQM